MKSLLNSIAVYALLVLIILGLFWQNKTLREGINRLETNYQASVENNAIQQEITKREYKKYYEKNLDSILKVMDIKSKNVKEVVITKYNIKDTTITHYSTEKVKIYGEDKFLIPKGCFTVSGKLDSTGITLNTIDNNDELTYILHRKHTKRFLFFRWAYQNQGLMYSKCKGDTIPIDINLKIE